MKHKVSELEGALLDAAVAKALGHRDLQIKNGEWRSRTEDCELSPIAAFSTNWAAGGPILDQMAPIDIQSLVTEYGIGRRVTVGVFMSDRGRLETSGSTILIAAMRAFVASKFGEEVDL